ncbi:MAG TPA: alpha/beta fold hydrolase [Gemmatimonadaceae bacterium]|nr:alpha/beta fold hydrolase [Gemmatimonadaceae bacterium]
MMLLLTIVSSVLAATLLWRALMARRAERASSARFAVNADGIIIGAEPITLGPPRATHAALLFHGFGDTPRTLEYAAAELHTRGYSVLAPLLPGHGRSLRLFAESRAEQWLDFARDSYREMCERYEHVSLVGLSMGGALATLLAAEATNLPALVLVAPYLDAPTYVRWLGRMHLPISVWAPYLRGKNVQSIHDDAERARSLAYGGMTARNLRELTWLADQARAALPRVKAPTLIVQSREDNRVAAAVAESAYEALCAQPKRLVWVQGCGHIITVDRCRAEVLQHVCAWLDEHAQGEGGARSALRA